MRRKINCWRNRLVFESKHRISFNALREGLPFNDLTKRVVRKTLCFFQTVLVIRRSESIPARVRTVFSFPRYRTLGPLTTNAVRRYYRGGTHWKQHRPLARFRWSAQGKRYFIHIVQCTRSMHNILLYDDGAGPLCCQTARGTVSGKVKYSAITIRRSYCPLIC